MRKAIGAIAIAAALAGCGSSDRTKTYNVPSGAMLPAIQIGSRITVDLDKRTPKLNDVVVFHPPTGAGQLGPVCGNRQQGAGHPAACDQPTPHESTETFLKRVVGLPGDRISLKNGEIIRDGKAETDHRIERCPQDAACTFPQTITVPSGEYYMLGDNRGASDDSRFWGPVPKSYIIGTVVT